MNQSNIEHGGAVRVRQGRHLVRRGQVGTVSGVRWDGYSVVVRVQFAPGVHVEYLPGDLEPLEYTFAADVVPSQRRVGSSLPCSIGALVQFAPGVHVEYLPGDVDPVAETASRSRVAPSVSEQSATTAPASRIGASS